MGDSVLSKIIMLCVPTVYEKGVKAKLKKIFTAGTETPSGTGRSCVTIYLFTLISRSRLLEIGVPGERARACLRVISQWRKIQQLSAFYRSVSERRKSPRVCAKINKQTCVRNPACNIQPTTHRQSTCSAAGGAGGLGMQQLENAEQVIYAETDIPPGTRIKKFFRGKNVHPETPCLRINSDFSKKIIIKKKNGAAWPHMALKVGSSINLQRGRRARTPVLHHLLPLSVGSLVFFCQAVNLHHF
jgi:hypothetical protein